MTPAPTRSVPRQVEHARAYVTRKGWTVDEAHVFIDDGVSGAEFTNRPSSVRLMNALKPRPAFDVLIMSESSRLGREAFETVYALKQLLTSSVGVFFDLDDRECTLTSPTNKLLFSMMTAIDDMERARGRQRTTDAMQQRARAGKVEEPQGPPRVGPRHDPRDSASPRLSRPVRLRAHEEAHAVRGAQPTRTDPTTWTTLDKPTWRIVDDALAAKVEARFAEQCAASVKPATTHAAHLLSGLLLCPCGANFEALRGRYVCSARRRRGPAVCANDFTLPIPRTDAVLLDAIEDALTHPAFIDRVVARACAPDDERARLTDERDRLAEEVANLTQAVASGGDVPALVAALRDRDVRTRALGLAGRDSRRR